MAERVAPTRIDADNSAGSSLAAFSDRHSVRGFRVGTGQPEPTSRCRIYDCMRFLIAIPIGQFLVPGEVSIEEGLGRTLDHGDAVVEAEIAFVAQRRSQVRERREVFDEGEALPGIERRVPWQVADRCERDGLKAEALGSGTGVREQPRSDTPATEAWPDIHFSDVQA